MFLKVTTFRINIAGRFEEFRRAFYLDNKYVRKECGSRTGPGVVAIFVTNYRLLE